MPCSGAGGGLPCALQWGCRVPCSGAGGGLTCALQWGRGWAAVCLAVGLRGRQGTRKKSPSLSYPPPPTPRRKRELRHFRLCWVDLDRHRTGSEREREREREGGREGERGRARERERASERERGPSATGPGPLPARPDCPRSLGPVCLASLLLGPDRPGPDRRKAQGVWTGARALGRAAIGCLPSSVI